MFNSRPLSSANELEILLSNTATSQFDLKFVPVTCSQKFWTKAMIGQLTYYVEQITLAFDSFWRRANARNVSFWMSLRLPIYIIIHQTHYEKSDWSRAFNQSTIACELDMINAISAADIAFIMSSSKSAWLLSPLECSPRKQNGWMLGSYFV